MASVWAQSAHVPSEVFGAAVRRAEQLGRDVVSDDLFLLALTDLDESQPARRALAIAGVNSQSLPALRSLDVTRDAIVQQLSELGIPVPQSDLPSLVEVEFGERVWFERDQINDVLDHVRVHVDPKTHWGFNYEGDRAWIHAERSIDMGALVRDALAGD